MAILLFLIKKRQTHRHFAHVWYIEHGELFRICERFKKPHYLDYIYAVGGLYIRHREVRKWCRLLNKCLNLFVFFAFLVFWILMYPYQSRSLRMMSRKISVHWFWKWVYINFMEISSCNLPSCCSINIWKD